MVYLPGEEGDYEIKTWGDKTFACIKKEKLKELDEEVGGGGFMCRLRGLVTKSLWLNTRDKKQI